MKIDFRLADSKVIREFFKHVLTGKDGESYDAGRAMGMFGGAAFLLFGFVQSCMGLYELVAHGHFTEFPFVNFGIGFGSVATGVGFLLKLKENTEPGAAPAAPADQVRP